MGAVDNCKFYSCRLREINISGGFDVYLVRYLVQFGDPGFLGLVVQYGRDLPPCQFGPFSADFPWPVNQDDYQAEEQETGVAGEESLQPGTAGPDFGAG